MKKSFKMISSSSSRKTFLLFCRNLTAAEVSAWGESFEKLMANEGSNFVVFKYFFSFLLIKVNTEQTLCPFCGFELMPVTYFLSQQTLMLSV